MKTAVYLCACGDNIASRMDLDAMGLELRGLAGVDRVVRLGFMCAQAGQDDMEADLRKSPPDRVVVAACSPRDHESTFRGVLSRAGLNPFLLQVVNIREQVAWVTPDRDVATAKALALVRAAVRRVEHQEPLETTELEVSTDVLVLGGGPAGLAAAQALGEAGRKVYLVERKPYLGGIPVAFEKVCPTLECGSCMMQTVLDGVLQDPNVEVVTLARAVEVAGSLGNFLVTVEQDARGVDPGLCITCGECIPPCPVRVPNEYAAGLGTRAAMAFALPGALPHVPFLDFQACLRSQGEDCRLCQAACPVEGAVRLADQPRRRELRVGAIVVATGAEVEHGSALTSLGHGRLPDVLTSLEVEARLASDGPTAGWVRTSSGAAPQRVAMVHCVGSMDAAHRDYCSGVCCGEAFKLSYLLQEKNPGLSVTHLYRTLCLPGREGTSLFNRVRTHAATSLVHLPGPGAVSVTGDPGGPAQVRWPGGSLEADLVILCPAIAPQTDQSATAKVFELRQDRHGFLEPLHGRTAAARTAVRGVFVAGTCTGPMDVSGAMTQGSAAAGHALSGLVAGRRLGISPVVASVDDMRCSGCRACLRVCPFRAIHMDPVRNVAHVNPALCVGCGTCVAGCPSGSIRGHHFTDAQLQAELDEVLA